MSVMIMTAKYCIYLNKKDTGYCYCDAIDLIASCGFWYINCFSLLHQDSSCSLLQWLCLIADLLDFVTDFMKAGSSMMYILVVFICM